MPDPLNPTPPLLAHETFVRVVRAARLDGLSILIFAGGFALLSAAGGSVQGAVLGSIISAAGAMELHGVALLRHGVARGIDWLVRSQLYLLTVMLGYCAWQLLHPDLGPLRALFHQLLRYPLMKQAWDLQLSMGTPEEILLRQFYTLVYLVVAVATLIYQGTMTVYYLRRRDAVIEALAVE